MDSFRFEPRQAELYERLRKIGAWPAAAFRDACAFFADESKFADLETAAHLVVHLQREIKSAIAQVLVPLDFKTPKEVDVAGVIAGIYAACGTAPTAETDQQLRAALAPFNLKKASMGGDKAALAAILEAFELPADHEIAQLWQAMGKLHDKAHRNALAAPRKLEDVAEAWEVFQKLLSLLLTQLDAAWALVYKRIDSILGVQHPGEGQVSQLRNKIPNNSNTFRYFFERATSNEWIVAITKDASLFTDPPDVGPWPAIAFLQRVAETHAQDVHRIATQLSRTPNVSIHMTIIAIANALPHELAKDLVLSEASAFADGDVHDDFIATELAKAAARIGSHAPDIALQTFEKLLALQRPASESIDDLTSPLDVHSYEDVVSAAAELNASAPRAAYDTLAKLLDAALQQAHGTPPNDNSNGWMPAIEPHEQNHLYDPLPHLAGAVRDAADACINADPNALAAVIEDCERRGWYFFRRLALHLLRHDPASLAARQRALDPGLLHQWWMKHEARLLIRAAFPHLNPDEKRRLIDDILRGPRDTDEPPDEESGRRQDWWIAQRLWWIEEWLPEDARGRYDELVAEHGQPDETQDFVAWVGAMWVGPTSPKTAAELAQMDVPGIVEFLRRWQPAAGRSFDAPSREGIGRELQAIANSRPLEFATAAASFIGLDATYVRGILNGLHTAVQNDQPVIAWAPVVVLANWIAEQPREIAGRVEDGWDDDDPHWGWARGAVARLFEVGFRDGASQIPIGLREQIWLILARISEDPDPSSEREQEHPSEPLSTAINSTRGQALEAVIWYSRWVRVSTPEDDRPKTFVDMPEVRTLLTEHLTKDASLAIRALYGQFLPLLRALDHGWFDDNITHFFPPNEPARRAATWQTYVVQAQARLNDDKALLGEHEHAIGLLSGEKPLYSHYHTHLARRMMWLFAAGALTLDTGGILERFFMAADDDTRAYAVGFAPHAVADVINEDDDAFRAKLAEFWTWCSGKPELAPSLRGFGMWFHEAKLELPWRLAQLERALTLAGHVMRDFEVIDDLASAAPEHPQAVVRCTRLLVNGADGMRLYTWVLDGRLRRIISAAIEHGDASTIAEARAFANHLVGRGFDSLLDLAA